MIFKREKITGKNKGNRKYGQAKFRHAKKGIYSLMIAVAVTAIFLALILTAFLHKGLAPAIVGSLGLITMIGTVIGILVGVRGFRERDKNYLTCKLGVGINGLIFVSLLGVFIRGII